MSTYGELRRAVAEDGRSLVRLERGDDRAVLTLSEADRLNPLSAGLCLQPQERLQELDRDPEIRSVALTGEDPAFSAGGDLEMIREGNRAIRDPAEPSDTTDPWRWIRRQFGEAREALELGLVQEVHAHEALLAGADAWCDLAARLPLHSLEMTKPLLRAAADSPWEESLKLEEFAEANCFSTAALGEAVEALSGQRASGDTR